MSQPSTAEASPATVTPSSGAPTRRLGLALAVIATAQLMVVLDATIVNVALPHIQTALGFSGSRTWSGSSTPTRWPSAACCCSAAGPATCWAAAGSSSSASLLFSVASLLGGFATSQAWLLAARALQGVGGAIAAPTALSLIADHLPRGPRAQPGDGRVRGDERGRRRGRACSPAAC